MKKPRTGKIVPQYLEIQQVTKERLKEIKDKTRKGYGIQVDEAVELYHKLNK